MNVTAEQMTELIAEVRKLRQAVERQQRALLNGKDAALFLGYSGPVFRDLVAKNVIPITRLDDDLVEPRYARVILERVIEARTKTMEEWSHAS